MPLPAPIARGIATTCLLTASFGCGEPKRLPPDAVEQFLERRDGVVTVLAGGDVGPDSLIGDIIDAQLTPNEPRVWVLDRYPPFVRLIEPPGRLALAFLELGDGPLEARRPSSIAVTPSHVAVLHSAGLNIYDRNGRVVRTHVHLPIGAEAVGVGCQGEWLLYGRSGRPLDPTHRAGIYSVRVLPDSIHLTVLRKDTTGAPFNQTVRRFHAFTNQRYVYDIRGTPRTIQKMSCGPPQLQIVAEMPPENVSTEVRRSGTRVKFIASLNDKTAILNGFAAVNESVIATFMADAGTGKIAMFDAGGGQYWVRTHKSYRLLDIQNGVALFRLADPAPMLLTANIDSLASLIRRSGVANVAVK